MTKRKRPFERYSGLKLWLLLGIALVVFGSFMAYYFWPTEDTLDGKSASLEELPDDLAAQETADPQYPPRTLRQAWHQVSAEDEDLFPRPENLPDDSSYVTLTGEYDQWLLGTPVEIAIPQTGKKYRSIVDEIAPDEFGNTIVHAKPATDEDEFRRLILTFSDSQTLAYVSTTLGSYELTGSEKVGWITSTNTLQKRRDYSQKDVIETQRDRHANTKYVPPRED